MARVINTPSVLFVPSWAAKQLGGDNYQEFRVIHNLISSYITHKETFSDADKEVIKTIRSKLSKYDLQFIKTLNTRIPEVLFNVNFNTYNVNKNHGIDPTKQDKHISWAYYDLFDSSDLYIEDVDLFNTLVKNIPNNMSGVENTDNYEIHVDDIGITVILHIGFGNAIVTNDQDTIVKTYSDIVNNMLKYFGEATYTSPYFESYMSNRSSVLNNQ